MSARAKPPAAAEDGPCVIRKGPYGASYDIGLIVRETRALVLVREYWRMGDRWTLSGRVSHWKQTDILARAEGFAAAEARLQRARAEHLAWEPAVQAATEALNAAVKAQKAARLAALTADETQEGGA